MYIMVCDRCKKQAEPQVRSGRPKGWVGIGVDIEWCSRSRKTYTLCPQCATALRIPQEDREQVKTVADRLLEILEEIAQGAVQG